MTSSFRPYDTYTPIEPSDLVSLRSVREGWYVEYKSEAVKEKPLAKSLSAFANQHGGWLFIGVGEKDMVADTFPGISKTDVESSLERLRNASKDVLWPPVFYETQVIEGPLPDVGLPENRVVLAVRIPESRDVPHLHGDGCVYVRVADASGPIRETDRYTLSRLWERGRDAQAKLGEQVVPTSEDFGTPEVHLMLTSDPFEIQGHWFGGRFDEFREIMNSGSIPFDTCFTSSAGFVGRQAKNNDAAHRVLTWQFSRTCRSNITIPLATSGNEQLRIWLQSYENANEFHAAVVGAFTSSPCVVDLNILFGMLGPLVGLHRALLAKAGVTTVPILAKVYLRGVRDVVPHLDLKSYVSHIQNNGVPIVQEERVHAPYGTTVSSFTRLLENDAVYDDQAVQETRDGVEIFKEIVLAFGLPLELMVKRDDAAELMQLLGRGMAVQSERGS